MIGRNPGNPMYTKMLANLLAQKQAIQHQYPGLKPEEINGAGKTKDSKQ